MEKKVSGISIFKHILTTKAFISYQIFLCLTKQLINIMQQRKTRSIMHEAENGKTHFSSSKKLLTRFCKQTGHSRQIEFWLLKKLFEIIGKTRKVNLKGSSFFGLFEGLVVGLFLELFLGTFK